jgi:sporulation protein YlmC with PRC-barrel domain
MTFALFVSRPRLGLSHRYSSSRRNNRCVATLVFWLQTANHSKTTPITQSDTRREHLMKRIVAISAGALIAGTAAFAQPMSSGRTELMTSVPAHSVTVTDWYKQNVYDRSDNKIGEIMDMLVEPNGQTAALIIGVGGFLGAGEKDVAVPFSAIKHAMKDNKVYLTMDATKDALKAAPAFKYDKETTSWISDRPAK